MTPWLKSVGERWLANLALFAGIVLAAGGLWGLGAFAGHPYGLIMGPVLALYLATLFGLPVAAGGLVLVEIIAAARVPKRVIRWLAVGLGALITLMQVGGPPSSAGPFIGLAIILFGALMVLPGRDG